MTARVPEYAGYGVEHVPLYYVSDAGELRPYENHGLPGDELLCKYSDVRIFIDTENLASDALRQQLAELQQKHQRGIEALMNLIKVQDSALRSLNKQLAEMRGALEFYANPLNYLKGQSPMTPYVNGELPKLKGRYDGGDIARAALSSPAREADREGGAEARDEKMFAFDIELRGEKARVEGWFSGSCPDDPCEFDIDAIWLGWSQANRGMPEHAGGPNPFDLSTLTDDEDEAIMDAAFAAVANLVEPTPAAETKGECETPTTTLLRAMDAGRSCMTCSDSGFVYEYCEGIPCGKAPCPECCTARAPAAEQSPQDGHGRCKGTMRLHGIDLNNEPYEVECDGCPDCRPAAQPAAERDGVIEELLTIRDFLCGAGTLRGCSFGEMPVGSRGNYWWREPLGVVVDRTIALLTQEK